MNKSELISRISVKSGLSRLNSERALNAAIESITVAMVKGDKVTVAGFGTFAVSDRPARVGRNPMTGNPLDIPPSKKITFRAGLTLKSELQALST